MNTLYVVYDTQEEELWGNNNKWAWARPAYAKNAWNVVNSGWRKNPKFTEQSRYEIREVTFNPKLLEKV